MPVEQAWPRGFAAIRRARTVSTEARRLRLAQNLIPPLSSPLLSAEAWGRDSPGRCRGTVPAPSKAIGLGVPSARPDSNREALPVVCLCFYPSRCSARPDPPPPLPLRGPPFPHSHLLLSNEKVIAENPNTPAAESPFWHLAARGGGLLGSTWCKILRHSTFGAAWHLRFCRQRKGQRLSRQWPPAGSWRAKATGPKDKKKAEGKVPPRSGDTAEKFQGPEEDFS